MLALAIVGMVVAVGGWLAGLDGSRTRLALDAAWRENRALRVLQETLRERAFDLAGRLGALESGLAAGRIELGRKPASALPPARR